MQCITSFVGGQCCCFSGTVSWSLDYGNLSSFYWICKKVIGLSKKAIDSSFREFKSGSLSEYLRLFYIFDRKFSLNS